MKWWDMPLLWVAMDILLVYYHVWSFNIKEHSTSKWFNFSWYALSSLITAWKDTFCLWFCSLQLYEFLMNYLELLFIFSEYIWKFLMNIPYARDKTAVDLFHFSLFCLWSIREGSLFNKAVYLVNLPASHLTDELDNN